MPGRKIDVEGLARFYADLAMKLAVTPEKVLMHGLKTAVERNVAGTDINTAASAWVTKGYLTQADADVIAALVTARDTPSEEEEEAEPNEEPGD